MKKVCIIGSSANKQRIQEVQMNLALNGEIVIGMHVFASADSVKLSDEQVEMLMRMHREMVDMSDYVALVHQFGPYSDRTMEMIEYAEIKGKYIVTI